MREAIWALGLALCGASLGVTACGGEANFGPAPGADESGASGSSPRGGRDQGGSSGAGATDGDAAGAAGEPAQPFGGTGSDPGGDEAGAAGSGGADPYLEPLLHAGLGPCQFLPEIASPTANPDCPNAVFEGDITIESASDIERLSGCERVTGNLTVFSETLTSLEGLEALKRVDGDLEIEVGHQEGRPPSNLKLKSLAGLNGLACVAGRATIVDAPGLWRDVKALGSLVEVGGNAFFDARGALSGLRRVFGVAAVGRTMELPRLEVAIGGIRQPASAPHLRYAGDESGCFYESVLGCDWTVETQSALDAISDVTLVVNSLRVAGSVSKLDPLRNLRKAGSLAIEAAAVASVEPLTALRRVSRLELANLNVDALDALSDLSDVREVRIADTPKLRTLAGLGRLHARDLLIEQTPELESLADLSLAADASRVRISNAPKLKNVEALRALRVVSTLQLEQVGVESLVDVSDVTVDRLTIANNAQLKHLELVDADVRFCTLLSNPALPTAGDLGTARFYSLRIEDNDALTSLAGLPPLDDASLTLLGNDSLTDLEGVHGNGTYLGVFGNASLQSLAGLELEDAAAVSIGENPTLADVSALTGLTVGDLKVTSNPKLETIPILAIIGSLDVSDNAQLTSINVEMGASAWSVTVARNAKLSTFDGFELTAVGQLLLEDNPELADLSALDGTSAEALLLRKLPKLTTVPAIGVGPGDLLIGENAELTSMSALQGAKGVEWARVFDNPKLGSLSGLPRTKSLNVENNASLVDLSGLELQSELEQLVIQDNSRLSSLRALSGVTSADYVGIYRNVSLPDCEVAWFGARVGQALELGQNGPTGPCP